ncbi:MAG: hypothetical protein R3D29_16035 [Nitratireductor sp.]
MSEVFIFLEHRSKGDAKGELKVKLGRITRPQHVAPDIRFDDAGRNIGLHRRGIAGAGASLDLSSPIRSKSG